MTKQQLINFGKKHKIDINGSLSKSDVIYELTIKAKKKFNTRTVNDDIKVVLEANNVAIKSTDKASLLGQLKKLNIDKELKEINTNTIYIKKKKTNHKPVIDVENLRVSFKSSRDRKQLVEVIRGISFKVHRGEIVALIGESGSGKSVTARSLFGMNENSITTADKMIISDVNMKESDEANSKIKSKNKEWRSIRGRKVSYIPQNPMTSLNPTMRISNQILEVMELHDRYTELSKKEKLEEAIRLLEQFGITNAKERIHLFPHEFSGGMRQRVVITMSVISRPDVIIADEPTTALDPTIQASVLSLFKVIAKKFNIAIIFVSHDISVVATLSDRINVFYAGRVVETAPKYELFTNSKHPYTWALLSSMPEANDGTTELYTLDGTPPNFASLPSGDPFSVRNKFALSIDFKQEPPLFKVPNSEEHYAATWLLHPEAPAVKRPIQVENIAKDVVKDYLNAKKK